MHHTKPATSEVAQSGHFDLWPVEDYHIMHCLYQWRRLHLAILEHRGIDEHVFNYNHTLHCTRLIMKWKDELKYGKNWTTMSEHSRYHRHPHLRTLY